MAIFTKFNLTVAAMSVASTIANDFIDVPRQYEGSVAALNEEAGHLVLVNEDAEGLKLFFDEIASDTTVKMGDRLRVEYTRNPYDFTTNAVFGTVRKDNVTITALD